MEISLGYISLSLSRNLNLKLKLSESMEHNFTEKTRYYLLVLQ